MFPDGMELTDAGENASGAGGQVMLSGDQRDWCLRNRILPEQGYWSCKGAIVVG